VGSRVGKPPSIRLTAARVAKATLAAILLHGAATDKQLVLAVGHELDRDSDEVARAEPREFMAVQRQATSSSRNS
jgi:hypothetical protein